ncbi:Intraflagellar_transport protein 88 [Hexamita inflata]|uniref:Intraflagellar transport protein 88 n=1 Tax=Hexamita inflata TaxID=28002 RepID=A0AA86NS58_9EUKA|nr:Intraflagellar transport protein 88 [Hexamita inflata]CAI9930859.1 Intraflagellar transport protein 88 [Hexamita inflata]CAI9969688.1 Intraflagellar transport protein 88 [Hexamita inflata]
MQGYRPTSSLKGAGGGMNVRPTSSITKAGFTSNPTQANQEKSPFDDLPKEEINQLPEKIAERMEQEIRQCIRDAMETCEDRQYSVSIARLQEAMNVETKLRRHHFANNTQQMINPDWQIVIKTHLCRVFTIAGQLDTALLNYEKLVKQVEKQQAAELRMFMGDIHIMKKNYINAVREYRKALDLAPPEYFRLRQKISRQLALASTHVDKWQEAIDTIEENLITSVALMNSRNQETDKQNIYALVTKFEPIFTLLICYYAMGNQKMMMDTFKRLIDCCQLIGDNPDLFNVTEENYWFTDNVQAGQDDELDELSRFNAIQRHEQKTKLLIAARLIAPSVCFNELQGFEKLSELLREKGHQSLSFQVQMSKALSLLEKNNFEDATKALLDIDRQGLETALAMGINIPPQVLQRSKNVSLTVAAAAEKAETDEQAEKKDVEHLEILERERLASAKALQKESQGKNKMPYATFVPRGVHTNIAFIQYLKGDFEAAFSHAQTAILTDPFDSFAKVNLGCTHAALNQPDQALKEFNDASDVNPDCLQAVYNAGLIFMRKQDYESAFMKFQRVISRLPRYADALFMSAEALIKMTRIDDAVVIVNNLISLNGHGVQDPGVYARLGELHHILGDESNGAHYFKEAHRLVPYNIDYIKWLGAYYIRQELYEQARICFEKGAQVDYQNPQWSLQAAACLRKTNQMQEAAAEYRKLLKKWPTNTDAMKFLIVCLESLNQVEEAVQWSQRLEKLQKGAIRQVSDEMNGGEKVMDPKVIRVSAEQVKDKQDVDQGDIFGAEDVAGQMLEEQ